MSSLQKKLSGTSLQKTVNEYNKIPPVGHLTKWNIVGQSRMFICHFILMKTSLTGTLFFVQKPKMILTKWDISLFRSSVADVFTNILCKIHVFNEDAEISYRDTSNWEN